jgi:hypothetical protein
LVVLEMAVFTQGTRRCHAPTDLIAYASTVLPA